MNRITTEQVLDAYGQTGYAPSELWPVSPNPGGGTRASALDVVHAVAGGDIPGCDWPERQRHQAARLGLSRGYLTGYVDGWADCDALNTPDSYMAPCSRPGCTGYRERMLADGYAEGCIDGLAARNAVLQAGDGLVR